MTAGPRLPSVWIALLRRSATLWPHSGSVSDDLRRSLHTLGDPVAPETVVRAGYGLGAVAALPGLVGWLLVLPAVGALPAALAVGGGVAHVVHRVPAWRVAAWRTLALGDVPTVVARLALRLRIEPSPERAAAAVGSDAVGPLATSLRDHARAARGTGESGLRAFAGEWAPWFPPVRRSATLLLAAAAAPAAERERTLDRALDAALDGTRDRLADFAGEVRAPATALYAGGVFLPLALVAVLPAARIAGVGVTVPLFAVVYVGVLPLALLAASAWLLARRPVAFPPPRVDRDHPDVPSARWPRLLAGLGAGGLAEAVAAVLVAPWAAPIAAVGIGAGTALVALARPVVAVRERVRAVEANLPDALSLVGAQVAEGAAVERAIATAGEEVPGATGEVFAAAATTLDALRLDVEAAFLGDHGALADLPSQRARSAARLLATAAGAGRPAGEALLATADHLDALRTVEREGKRDLARVTDTLRQTGTVFAPLVGGATVALAGGVAGGTAPGGAEALPVPALGAVVGCYVLELAVLLPGLSVGLAHGLDRALVGYRVGRACLVATPTYLGAYLAAGLAL